MLNWIRSFFRREPRATMDDFCRIKYECEDRGRFEDKCFDEWWPQNEHRFPLKRVRWMSASEDYFLTPTMEERHYKEFAEYFNRRLAERA
jgi:hypothetical protein